MNSGDMLRVIQTWSKICNLDENRFAVGDNSESLDDVKLFPPLKPPRKRDVCG